MAQVSCSHNIAFSFYQSVSTKTLHDKPVSSLIPAFLTRPYNSQNTLRSSFLIFPTTPQKSQHNVEFSKCYITQLHKIPSKNTSTEDFKTLKWNYSPTHQENRSLKVNPVRTQLMTNCQNTNYEVKWSQCVKQLAASWGFSKFCFPCTMFYTVEPLVLMVIVPNSKQSSTFSQLNTLGKLAGKLLGWFYRTSFFLGRNG